VRIVSDVLELPVEFESAIAALSDGHYPEAVDMVVNALASSRNTAVERGGVEAWQTHAAQMRASPVFELAQRDPFTSHSVKRPRGYPGDALLLDWIYRDFRLLKQPAPNTEASSLYREVIKMSAAEAVRWRRQRLADIIDETAARTPNARVLAVAAGHLREADLSVALQRGRIGEVVALDQDEESLAEVERRYTASGMPVTTVKAPIRDVIAGRYKVADFDLIYSAGLYDYLAEPVAEKLTSTLWRGLKPGGTLVLTNFLEGAKDRGWMEAMMDWWLIFRTHEQIGAFANGIPQSEIHRRHAYVCPTDSVGYLSLRKTKQVN